MRKLVSAMVLVMVVAVGLLCISQPASAEEIKMVGVITKIEIAGKDAQVATATLKDNKSGNLVVVTVKDDLTLDKFKDHRIVEGDSEGTS